MSSLPQIGLSARERFLLYASLDRETLCWNWTGTRSHDGYGAFVPALGEKWMVHRWAHVEFVGPIPEGYEVDHLCFNPSCVNPAHLEAVTPEENHFRRRGRPRKSPTLRERCKNGHPFTLENTRLVLKRGSRVRVCKTCVRAASARYAERQRQRAAA